MVATKAAVVVGNSGVPTTGDALVQGWLAAMPDFTAADYIDDGAAEGTITAADYKLIVVMESVASATVGTKWRDVAIPLLMLDGTLWDAHEFFTATNASTTTEDRFEVLTPRVSWVPLTAGDYDLEDSAAAVNIVFTNEANLPAGAVVVAARETEDFAILAWTFETGAAMHNSVLAPARRGTLTARETHLAAGFSANYQTFFEGMVKWLTGTVADVPVAPAEGEPRDAALVVFDTDMLTPANLWLGGVIEDAGYTVRYVKGDDGETATPVDEVQVVVVADLGLALATDQTAWKDWEGPVVTLSQSLWAVAYHALSDASSTSADDHFVVPADPPSWLTLTAGTYDFTAAAASALVGYRDASAGIPAAADLVARIEAGTDNFCLFTYETGDVRADSTTVPDKRAAITGRDGHLGDVGDPPSDDYTTLMYDLLLWVRVDSLFGPPTQTASQISWETADNGTWVAYVGWNGLALVVMAETGGSALILDDPELGLLNSALLGPAGDGWQDMGCDLHDLEIVRGATEDAGVLTRYEAGTASLELWNLAGEYDPVAPTSALGGQLELGTQILVGGWTIAVAEFLSTHPAFNPWDYLHILFLGRIDDWAVSGYETEGSTATFHCVDSIQQLQQYNSLEQASQGTGETTFARINRILDHAGWSLQTGSFGGVLQTEVSWYGGDTYNPTHQATTLAQPAWEMLLLTADAASRTVLVQGNGLIASIPVSPTAYDEWDEFYWGCASGTDTNNGFADGASSEQQIPPVSFTTGYNRDQLINIVDAAQVGGTEQTVENTTSVTRHGAYRWGRTDLTLEDDADVLSFAQFIIARSSEPAPRIVRMLVSPSLWPSDQYAVRVDQVEVVAEVESRTQVSRNGWTVMLDVFDILGSWGQRHVIDTDVDLPNGQSITLADTVAVRGGTFRLDPNWVEIEFVTTSIAQFLQILTVEDAVDGFLDTGRRVA